MSGPSEMLDGSVPGEEEVTNEEHEIHEGSELDRPAVAGALRVFTESQAEVEASLMRLCRFLNRGFLN